MKKSLLLLAACALSLNAATAEEITENFSDLSGIPTSLSAETSAPVSSANETEYTFTSCFFNTKNSVFNFTNDGAAFTAKLPDSYNCSSIQLIGASNTTTGKACQIKLSADGTEIEAVTVDTDTKNFTFAIPEEYQGAGTTYSFERVGGSNRFSSIVYTVEKVEKETWAVPEFNIPEESYVLVGQEISVTNVPEGAELALSYKARANGDVVKVEGNSFAIPADAPVPCRVFVTAEFSGQGKVSSKAELIVNLTNTKRPSVASFEYIGYENYPIGSQAYPSGAAVIYYKIGIINIGGNSNTVTATVNLYDSAGTEIIRTMTTDNLNVAVSNAMAVADGIRPLEPTVLDKNFVIEGLSNGDYLVEMATAIGATETVVIEKGTKEITVSNSFTTGVEEVNAAHGQPAVYYNLQGARVADPRPGQLLIKVQGGKAVKTLIR